MILLANRTDPCPRHLGNNPAGLACTSTAGHDYGCTYEASDCADGRHDDAGSDNQ